MTAPVNKNSFIRTLLWVTGMSLLVIAMIWANAFMRSRKYAIEGDTFFRDGKLLEAVSSYETAAHAYTPWNPHVRHSLEKLWETGELLESKYTDPTYALVAYRSLRSSVYAIRSFYMPYKEWVPKSDEKITELVNIQRRLIEEATDNSMAGNQISSGS